MRHLRGVETRLLSTTTIRPWRNISPSSSSRSSEKRSSWDQSWSVQRRSLALFSFFSPPPPPPLLFPAFDDDCSTNSLTVATRGVGDCGFTCSRFRQIDEARVILLQACSVGLCSTRQASIHRDSGGGTIYRVENVSRKTRFVLLR